MYTGCSIFKRSSEFLTMSIHLSHSPKNYLFSLVIWVDVNFCCLSFQSTSSITFALKNVSFIVILCRKENWASWPGLVLTPQIDFRKIKLSSQKKSKVSTYKKWPDKTGWSQKISPQKSTTITSTSYIKGSQRKGPFSKVVTTMHYHKVSGSSKKDHVCECCCCYIC